MNNKIYILTLNSIDLYLSQQLVEHLKQTTMKRFLALTAIAAFLAVVASCGSSQGGHCDAYGSVDQVDQSSDVASR